jgi:hypothetical protein
VVQQPEAPARVAVGGLLAGLAGVHLLALSDEFADAPLLGIADVAVIVGAAAGIWLLAIHDRRGWLLATAVALVSLGAAIAGRLSSSAVALDDIGDWNHVVGACAMVAAAVLAPFALVAHWRLRAR